MPAQTTDRAITTSRDRIDQAKLCVKLYLPASRDQRSLMPVSDVAALIKKGACQALNAEAPVIDAARNSAKGQGTEH